MHLKMVPLGEAMDQREPREFVDKNHNKRCTKSFYFYRAPKVPFKKYLHFQNSSAFKRTVSLAFFFGYSTELSDKTAGCLVKFKFQISSELF
jgi:hypothetical protein